MRALTIVLVTAVFLMLSAQQSASLSQTVANLEDEVHGLQNRVERLEAHATKNDRTYLDRSISDGGAPAPRKAASPSRVMRIEGVETLEPDPGDFDRLEELQDEVDAMEKTVENSKRRAASTGASTGGSYRGRYKNTSSQRRARSESEMLAEYQRKYREKQGELKKLERELNEPRQLIVGRMGNTVIQLETTRDQSRKLDRISLGDYITWEGRRVRSDKSSQEWIVTTINAAEAPE